MSEDTEESPSDASSDSVTDSVSPEDVPDFEGQLIANSEDSDKKADE